MVDQEDNFLSGVDQKEIENLDSNNSETFTRVQPVVQSKNKSKTKNSADNIRTFKPKNNQKSNPYKAINQKIDQTSKSNSYETKYHNIPTFQPKKTPVAQIVIFIISFIFLLVALFLFGAFVYPGFFNDASNNSGTDSVSSNTATLQAVNPIDDSNLAQSIPNLVTIDDQNFILTNEEYSEKFLDDQREFSLIYTNGTLSYGVTIGQWESAQLVTSYFETIKPSSEIILETGDVEVGGVVKGTYILYQDELDSAQGFIIWQNETLLIKVEGEIDTLMNFYYAYNL